MPITVPSASEPVVTCYTKVAWADSWTERPLLQALQISEQVAPAHPSAILAYRYGRAMLPEISSRAADSALTTIARGSLTGHYVKIVITGLGTWHGIIVDVSDNRAGVLGGTIPTGVEQYTAFGLTWFLDQVPILASKVKVQSGSVLIDRCIPFNGGTDGTRRKNRVSWKNYDSSSKCFTDRTQTTEPAAWKASNAIEYLLANFAPLDASGAALIPFALHASALTFLDYEVGLIDYESMTPWQLITRLIDRRRGLGCHATIVSDTVTLVAWSQNATTITLPSGSEIPANPNTMTYDFDPAVNIKNAQVSTTLVAKFDQVIVRGERAGSVFTVRPSTNMQADWTTEDETKYDKGATTKTGYSDLSDSDKVAANQDVRASDPLARVYSWWKLRTPWDGRSATDPATGGAPYAFPKIDADGEADTSEGANVQIAGLRIEPFLPLRQGVNYAKTSITVDTDTEDDAETDFLAPLLLFKAPVIRTSTQDAGWLHCERLNQASSSGSASRAFEFSVDLSVREDAPGLILKTIGKPQHFIANDLFEPQLDGEEVGPDSFSRLDWLATVYMLQDQWCRAAYPLAEDLPERDLIRPFSLQVPGAHLDYVVPGTIVAVDAGELKKTASGGYVRDDRKKLKDIARLAYSWHGQERRILQLSFRGITSGFSLGHLITTIGSGGLTETVNTAITSITYDLQGGMTSLSTSFGELDFTI